jgi:hypothetical protein
MKYVLYLSFLITISISVLSVGKIMADSEKYSEGQAWSYKTRIGEQESKIYIAQVDNDPKLGQIYHIYIDNIAIKNPHIKEGIQNYLPHAPVSQKTLDDSVTNLIESHVDPLPDISEGYLTWKEAFVKGEAGVFTIPADKIVQYIEDVVTGKNDNR